MKHKWRLGEDGTPDDWAWESGFHNGVYCERCGKTVCIHCHTDWEEMDDCEEVENEPMTNADRIRAMSDEELAAIFDKGCPPDRLPKECVQYWKVSCKGCWADWLKQPVKDGEDDG